MGCKYCGQEFKKRTRGKDSNLYCSRECAFADKKAKPRVKVNPICVVCSKEFEGRTNARYCSDECRREIARSKGRDYWHKNKAAAVINEYVTKTCKECGCSFTINFYAGNREYCSDKCARKQEREEYKQYRKEQMKNAFVMPVYFSKIYKRDKGICQICGKPVAYDKSPEDPMGATIDHIIPLSRGGKHHPGNCQLAHRRCNSIKGTAIPDETAMSM